MEGCRRGEKVFAILFPPHASPPQYVVKLKTVQICGKHSCHSCISSVEAHEKSRVTRQVLAAAAAAAAGGGHATKHE
jgi:hypothetical protein